MPVDISQGLHIFSCYTLEDKGLQDKLVLHLSSLRHQFQFISRYDRLILPNQNWQKEFDPRLNTAHIVLLLISPDFMASDYCYGIEMKYILERQKNNEIYVLPIILRPTNWKNAPFSNLQILPTQGKPITQWNNRDSAFVDVVDGITKLVEKLLQDYQQGQSPHPYPQQPSSVPISAFSPASTSYPQILKSQSLPAPLQTNTFSSRFQLTPYHSSQTGVFTTTQDNTNTPPHTLYNKWLFVSLVFSYILGWCLAVPYFIVTGGTSSTPSPFSSGPLLILDVLNNIGIGLLVIVAIVILVIDWHAATTLCGLIKWKMVKGKWRFFAILLYIGGIPLVLGIYFAYIIITQFKLSAQNKQNIP